LSTTCSVHDFIYNVAILGNSTCLQLLHTYIHGILEEGIMKLL